MIASLDIESLYSSIDHELGIKAAQHFLTMKCTHFQRLNDFTLTLLCFLFTHNYFIFEVKFYHQARGIAMGTICANLFLWWWEETIVFSDDLVAYMPETV